MLIVPRFYIDFAYNSTPSPDSNDQLAAHLLPQESDVEVVDNTEPPSVFGSKGNPYPFGPRGPYLFRCIGAVSFGLGIDGTDPTPGITYP
eukprot:gene30844-16345_t